MTATLVLAAAALAACSPAPDDPGTTALGIDLEAQVDPATGAVVLPYDRLTADFYETDRLATGASAAVSACAAESGVSFDPPPLVDDPVYSSEHYFGPWTTDQASRFGFVPPMSLRDMAANGIAGAPDAGAPAQQLEDDLDDDAWEVIDACNRDDADVTTLLDATRVTGPWVDDFQAVHDTLLDDDEASDLLAELTTCLEAAGLRPDEGAPWLPEGAEAGRISQGQIEMALTVVGCKDGLDFTERMAGIEARLQEPLLRRYAAELAEQRRVIDDALELASARLADATLRG